MANTPDRRSRLAQALRDNLKRRKEQERQRSAAAEADEDAPVVEKAPEQEGKLP